MDTKVSGGNRPEEILFGELLPYFINEKQFGGAKFKFRGYAPQVPFISSLPNSDNNKTFNKIHMYVACLLFLVSSLFFSLLSRGVLNYC